MGFLGSKPLCCRMRHHADTDNKQRLVLGAAENRSNPSRGVEIGLCPNENYLSRNNITRDIYVLRLKSGNPSAHRHQLTRAKEGRRAGGLDRA